jgi:hypothetical protein
VQPAALVEEPDERLGVVEVGVQQGSRLLGVTNKIHT